MGGLFSNQKQSRPRSF